MKAMILAAGKGERLKPLSNHTPKPLLKINKQCLIEYHIHALVKAGLEDIVINVSHLADQIIEKIGNGEHYHANIQYSIETEPLETAGGIFNALPLLGQKPFITVSADIYTNYDFKNLIARPINAAHLVLTENPPFHPLGDFALDNSIIRNTGKPLYNFAGISVLSPDLFQHCQAGRFSLSPLLRAAIDNNQVTGEYFNGIWHNIGTIDIYHAVKKQFEK